MSEQYSIGFQRSLSETEGIYYASLGWHDDEIANFSRALAQCPARRLKRLRLQNNLLGDRSAYLLAEALALGHLPVLEQLKLNGNRSLTEPAKERLRAVCKERSVELLLDESQPAAEDAGLGA